MVSYILKGEMKKMDISPLIYLGLIGSVTYLLREIPKQLFNTFLNTFSFSITTSSRDADSYYSVNQWLLSLNKRSVKNNLNAKKEYSKSGSFTDYSINYGNYHFMHNGCFIFVNKKLLENTWSISDNLTVRILGFKQSFLKEEILSNINKTNKTDCIKVFPMPDAWQSYLVPKKSFNDVFIKDKNRIIKHLENWKNSKEMYHKHGITYKTGILLHGEAGTGKTSTAKAIASYLGFNIHTINVKSYKDEQSLINKVISIPEKSVVLFEDIDCVLGSREDELETETKALLGTILNILDGALSPTNVVFVATTNHLEKLDDALIRNGRFDLKVNAGLIEKEQAEEMCASYEIDSAQVLTNEVFPINPSYLQNKIFEYVNKTA